MGTLVLLHTKYSYYYNTGTPSINFYKARAIAWLLPRQVLPTDFYDYTLRTSRHTTTTQQHCRPRAGQGQAGWAGTTYCI